MRSCAGQQEDFWARAVITAEPMDPHVHPRGRTNPAVWRSQTLRRLHMCVFPALCFPTSQRGVSGGQPISCQRVRESEPRRLKNDTHVCHHQPHLRPLLRGRRTAGPRMRFCQDQTVLITIASSYWQTIFLLCIPAFGTDTHMPQQPNCLQMDFWRPIWAPTDHQHVNMTQQNPSAVHQADPSRADKPDKQEVAWGSQNKRQETVEHL